MVKTTSDRSTSISTTKIVQTKRDCDSGIDEHLLDNDQCAINCDNKRFLIFATVRSSFHLDLLEAAYTLRVSARYYADRRSLFILSNSFDIMAFLFGLLMRFF